MLNSIDRICGPVAVVKYQGQPLHMIKQSCAEIPDKFLTRISLQPPRSQALQVHQHRDSEQHKD